jgi:N-acetylmuramic acid 6-phosphate etherase
MTRYVIGVDGGGSKTAAVVVNQRGQVLGRGSSGSSNYHNVGLDKAREALLDVMHQAIGDAGLDLGQIAAVTWALAGVDHPHERRLFSEMAAEILPGIPVGVENDAVAALIGGVGARYGVVLIAGTGMVVYGVNRQGEEARAGGWGYFLDHGNAYHLAQEALRTIVCAHDGSDLFTRLTERVLHLLDLEEPADLVAWVYAPERQVAEIAALAPLVLAEAEEGDLAAVDVVAQGADALAMAVDTVARRLALWETPFPLVLAGGLMTSNAFYRQVVMQAVHTRVPHAQPSLPRADPAVGAAWLALESLGYTLDVPASSETVREQVWATEQTNALTQDLDLRTALEIVGLMHAEDRRALRAVRTTLPAIAQAVEAIAARLSAGGRLIYVGAGTSGRLGVLDASECSPTFDTDPAQVLGVIAGVERAIRFSVEGAEDDTEAGRKDVARLDVGVQDCVVGISASGWTPYTIAAVEGARDRGALTIALVCNLPAPLAEIADHVIAPLVGPEVIAGSTRLKAGTVQKVVLNMLSTATMVRLGKTFGNLMVDVRQENVKLQARARRIVAQACGVSDEEAAQALARSSGDTKVAIVSILRGCSPEEARKRLACADGIVRAAL